MSKIKITESDLIESKGIKITESDLAGKPSNSSSNSSGDFGKPSNFSGKPLGPSGKPSGFSLKSFLVLQSVILVGVVVGVVLMMSVRSWWRSNHISPRIHYHLDVAEKQSKDAAARAEEELRAFFDVARQNTRRFAEHALNSKWIATKDWFLGGNRVEEYVTQCFYEDIFSPESLKKELQDILDVYLKEIESIENEMLVNDLPADSILRVESPQKVMQIFQVIFQEITEKSKADLTRSISRETVSFIAGEIVAAITIQMATSAGILGTSTVLGPETLGLSIVVGFIVDAVVSWIWDKCADPTGEVAQAVCEQLNHMEKVAIEGGGDVKGFREQLEVMGQERAKIRREAVKKMVSPESGSTL